MYNVSDQNKTNSQSVAGHDSSMTVRLISRKASRSLLQGKERDKVLWTTGQKETKKKKKRQASSFPLEPTPSRERTSSPHTLHLI